jgi:hypothetical protein
VRRPQDARESSPRQTLYKLTGRARTCRPTALSRGVDRTKAQGRRAYLVLRAEGAYKEAGGPRARQSLSAQVLIPDVWLTREINLLPTGAVGQVTNEGAETITREEADGEASWPRSSGRGSFAPAHDRPGDGCGQEACVPVPPAPRSWPGSIFPSLSLSVGRPPPP